MPLTSQQRHGTTGHDGALDGPTPCSAEVRLAACLPALPAPLALFSRPRLAVIKATASQVAEVLSGPSPKEGLGQGLGGPSNLHLRTPAPTSDPDRPFPAGSWGLRWQLSPSLPTSSSPAMEGQVKKRVPGGAPSDQSLCQSCLGLGDLYCFFLICLDCRPQFQDHCVGHPVALKPYGGRGRPYPPLPCARSALATNSSRSGCLPSHPIRPVNLTAGRGWLGGGGGFSLKEPSEGALGPLGFSPPAG